MKKTSTPHHHFMELALEEARKAFILREVPVGAIVVSQGKIIARAHNSVEQDHDATAHAELKALKSACASLEKYLPHCTLYVTLEPCPMCAMACYWTQVQHIVFGALDPKKGYQSISPKLIHPKTKVTAGLLAQESTALLQTFFQQLR